jgi:hypothetical protein
MCGRLASGHVIVGEISSTPKRLYESTFACELISRAEGLVELYVPAELIADKSGLFQSGQLLCVKGAVTREPTTIMAVDDAWPSPF